MKTNKLQLLLVCLLLISALLVPTFGLQAGVQIDGKFFDGKAYLPLRKTFEALNFEVSWDDYARLIVAKRGDEVLRFKPGQRYMLYNDVLLDATRPLLIENGSSYLTVDFAKQIFGKIRLLGGNRFQISSQLVKVDRSARSLESDAEMNALLSFYPQISLYRKGGVLMENDVVMAPMMNGDDIQSKVAENEETSADHSDTNNQVAGVAEADIVKTDGQYIYALKDDLLQVVRAQRGSLEVVAKLQPKDLYPSEMFLYGDKLVLIGNGFATDFTKESNEDLDVLEIERLYYRSLTFVDIYDISALESGKIERLKRISVDADYQSGRRIDNFLYLVATQGTYGIMPFEDGLVQTMTTLPAADKVMYFPGCDPRQMMYTIGIDLNDLSDEKIDIQAYLGGAQNIYADQTSFYISDVRYIWSDDGQMTNIYKFAIADGKFDYQSNCSLPGELLNQFSMDVHNGYFRVAMTTRNPKKWDESLNHLLILDQDLAVVGKVADLAPGERIYSTRMLGDKVFMVTYRQVDPFYVIDTADPTAPKVLGYLKIPGYSCYLHPYDKNTIIGVGMNTVEKENGRIVNDGVKISLFDISNPQKPIEKDMVLIGDGNANTDVNYDHKAFLFNASKNILALPVQLSTPYGYSKDAYIFQFDKSGKLSLKGVISHADMAAKDKHYSDFNKQINRIMYIGNDLYTLSNSYLFLNDFNSLERIDVLER